jgi:beta-galactosidase
MKPQETSRRQFVRNIAPLTFGSLLLSRTGQADVTSGPARYRIPLDGGWLFGGKLTGGATKREFDDRAFEKITLPHCVARLSWQDWDPAAWQDVWAYRRHFLLPREAKDRRVFVEFDGVMTAATPFINGRALPEHLGGYLPFRHEITKLLTPGDNVLAVAVDSRWKNVPPDGSPKGPISVDYLEPGGIYRPVRLSIVPQVYISDVFAKPVDVLESRRRVEVTCSIDAAEAGPAPVEIKAELVDGDRTVASARQSLRLEKPGTTEVRLTLSDPGNIALWHPDSPRLYYVVTTLSVQGKPVHDYRVRIGFREARFEVDGFFLNGRRMHFFGLNRHEIYPYAGGAMPPRVLRRDAEILRHEFHCNIVRCSHYPQSEAFLDACDELGLMAWEEPPGWGYLGDDAWKELVVRDVRDMILRDRNHPSIVIWGVRVNESRTDVPLYARTTELAHTLDGTRPASGSMTSATMRVWKEGWKEDVFALDDYHARPDGTVGIEEPLPGVPYMLAEVVGQFNYTARKNFDAKYLRTADVATQTAQAVRHAQAHDRARAWPRFCGVIAWCAFDYASLVNCHRAVKTPGVADVFRVPKLGAAFYQSQVSPDVKPIIIPDFYWDFGPQTPAGPGRNAAIFSNCERLEIFIDGRRVATVLPDRAGFPNLDYPPFFCDLTAEGSAHPDLRIDGYAGSRLVLSRSFSSDRARDRFAIAADDDELTGDGSDATRLIFHVVDRFGAPRLLAGGDVTFDIKGPGTIMGDNPFHLTDSGGVGAVWIKTTPRGAGRIRVTAAHSTFGSRSVEIRVRRAAPPKP